MNGIISLAATVYAILYLTGIFLFVAFFVTIFSYIAYNEISKKIRQARCKHEKYFETGSCRAICIECHKDLGFIGDVRKARQK